mgnify:CR=1 FL=1
MSTSFRRRPVRLTITSLVSLIVLLVLFLALITIGSAYTPVEVGTVVLIKRFGGLTGAVLEPGLHWRIPFIDQAIVIPTVVLSYETSDNPQTSGANYPDYPVNAQTIDGQQVIIKYTVLFRLPPQQAVKIVQNVGRTEAVVENVIKAHSRNLARLWAQNYTAEDLYSGEGIFNYEMKVQEELAGELEKYGVILESFLVRKVEFDEDYIRAIEQQQIAQEAIETASYEAEAAKYKKEEQIRLAEAEAERIKLQAAAEAERIRLQAAAEAERQRLLADAEAYSIQARGKALEQFPQLVQWEFVRNLQNVRWGILPGENLTPLLPLPTGEGQTRSVP